MNVNRLAPALGAEITGIDLSGSDGADSAVIDGVLAAIHQHQVVAIRSQDLDPAALVALAERFGTPEVHPIVPHLDGFPPVQEIKNYGKRVTLNEHWHTDVSFQPQPPKYTMLHARSVPELGGDTAFANQYLAYDSLSEGLRTTIDGLRAEHRGEGLAIVMGKDPKDAPRAVHPIARTHPVTSKKALYVCAAFTRHIDGWTTEESAGLLAHLYERSARPDFTYRHHWLPGDMVVWDNRCVLHYAIHDHDDGNRTLHRVTIAGETPE